MGHVGDEVGLAAFMDVWNLMFDMGLGGSKSGWDYREDL